MGLKVTISPTFNHKDAGDGGIRRICEAEIKHLPAYDIEIIDDQRAADVVQIHAMANVDTDAPIVASTHGLYWTADQKWPKWAWGANFDVLEVVKRAELVTAPSEWVANSFRRGMLVDPIVIGHGIDIEDWTPRESRGYVLWNKARVDVICDPEPVNQLAIVAPETKFVSTFGVKTANVAIIGRLSYEQMKPVVEYADVYLCTAKETFGIGTLEALAAGVPVLGWDWGGQVDIIRHRETGYLAKSGDYGDLLEGLRFCQQNRQQLSDAARQDMIERFQWKDVIGKYAEVFQRASSLYKGPKVSVIVTCYKLEEYLVDCLKSVSQQTMKDWEVIVVDDHSPVDETRNCRQLVADYAQVDPRVRYIRNSQNLYLAEARNVGIRAARGKYILPLDADDMIAPNTLEVLSGALDKDQGLHVAYGAFELIEPDGRRWISEWPKPFDYDALMGRKNQNPYCSLYRKRVWEVTGGYRRRMKTAEDAEFWVRAASYGFRSKKVTDAVTLVYRNRPDSMSHSLATPDFCAWFPWADKKELTPYGSQGTPVGGKQSWPVSAFDQPEVSVVIPVGPDHGKYLQDALDSVLAQTYQKWEALVISDTDEDLTPWLQGFPFARLLKTPRAGGGPGVARNIGVQAARGKYVVCLDADDALLPSFIEDCLAVTPQAHEYVYGDHLSVRHNQKPEVGHSKDFNCEALLRESLHAVTVLAPKRAFLECPFDEKLRGWEDWEIFIRMVLKGWCGVRIAKPLLVYRLDAGSRRERSLENKEVLLEAIASRYKEYLEGSKKMACGGCGRRTPKPVATPAAAASNAAKNDNDLVLVEYTTANIATHLVVGAATRTQYGRRKGGERFYMYAADQRAATNLFRVV